MALYVWQAFLSYFRPLQPAADFLGLFLLSPRLPASELWPAATQLASLLLLFAALGFLRRQRNGSGGGGAAGGGDSVGLSVLARALGRESFATRQRSYSADLGRGPPSSGPLLGSSREEAAAPAAPDFPAGGDHPWAVPGGSGRESPGPRGRPRRAPSWRRVVLPLAFEAVVAGLELLCSRPAAVAAALCALAMVQPSVMGGALLALGLLALLLPPRPGGRLLRAHSDALCAVLLAWLAACYVATALQRLFPVSAEAEALGLHAFPRPSAAGPLAAMLLCAAAAAALARSSRAAEPAALPAAPPQLQRLLASLAGPGSPPAGGGGSPLGSPLSYDPASPSGLSGRWDGGGGGGAQGAWGLVHQFALRVLWYLGFLALPALLFVVGGAGFDVLHGAYLAGLLLQLAAAALRARPAISEVRAGVPMSISVL